MLITQQQLQKIAPSLKDDYAKEITDLLNLICPQYGITPAAFNCFLATIVHESGEFSIKEESLNYTHAQRIVDVWPSRFNLTGSNGKLNANDYVRNPQKLANAVYNNRMGNRPDSSDGWDFRGSGFIQLTGRESFQRYGTYHGITDLEDVAEKLRTLDWWAVDSACWEFAIDKKLIPIAENGDFKTVTLRINGGLIGWNDRLNYYYRSIKS